MRGFKIAILIGILGCSFSACEKDDICVDGDTPLLVVEFYDFENQDETKEVTTLVVRGDDGTTTELPVITNTSASAISLPLRPNLGSTEFLFSQNLTPTDTTTVNIDRVSFSYVTTEKFVSRACGFIANYNSVVGNLSIETGEGNWIKDIEVVIPEIENSSETHVKIYH